MLRRSAPEARTLRGRLAAWRGGSGERRGEGGAGPTSSAWPADRWSRRPAERPPLDLGGASDRGRRRLENEDSYAVVPLHGATGAHTVTGSGATLLVVADGVGGSAGGEVASHLAVESVVDGLTRSPHRGSARGEAPNDTAPRGDGDPGRALRRAVERAARSVVRVAREREDLRGLGTTLTAAVLRYPYLWLAHVGDSRAYLWRDGGLYRLTRDHTVAQRLREEGALAPGEGMGRLESVLWNAIGGSSDEVQIEERQERLHPGDGLLLCSDGLTRHLSDDELARRIARGLAAGELCDDLVRAANRAGGEDNITVVFARVGAQAPS
jgi:protein phosphatase